MNNKYHISYFGLISSSCFLILSFIGRVLFPFGDEPDFDPRASMVLYDEHAWWTPYFIFKDLLSYLNPVSFCQIDTTRMSLYADIGLGCIESFEQIAIRFLITGIIVSPLLFVIVFRDFFIAIMYVLKFRLTHEEWHHRLDALSLTIIFPSIIFYLGVLAEEQFTLVLSIFIFLFWGSFLIVIFLLFLIASIDIGNAIVVTTFVFFGYFSIFTAKYISVRFSFLVMLSIVILAYIIGPMLLVYIEKISFLTTTAQEMYENTLLAQNKYPILLRPFITFMTGIFMTASGVKVVFVYVLYATILVLLFYKLYVLRKKNLSHRVNYIYVLLCSTFTTILFFVFMFPDYAFAKYYVFMMPFILLAALLVFNKFNILKIILLSNLIIFIYLIIYRL